MSDIAFYRGQKTARWWSVCTTPYESRFSLSSDSHRILIWRERGSRNHPSNIIERDRYGGRGVLVWGGIMLGSRTDLHIFDAGSVNGTRYCNEILLPYVRLFRGAMGLQFPFYGRQCTMLSHSSCRTALRECLAARTLPPVTVRELRLALQDEWAAMPQQLIDTLILSMGRRCETCLAVREIISPTKDRMFLAGHPSQGYFGLQSHCAPCYFFNQASFYPSDFSFIYSRPLIEFSPSPQGGRAPQFEKRCPRKFVEGTQKNKMLLLQVSLEEKKTSGVRVGEFLSQSSTTPYPIIWFRNSLVRNCINGDGMGESDSPCWLNN
ncbi:transposable element Tcb2 transposase [Trichonephila clavipes]|nr:transposable element Tcb2 transposase [Trichonephila clavipes]